MSILDQSNQQFPLALRLAFGVIAIATLLANAPWSQPDFLQMTTSYASSLMWGLLAIFGYKPGWPRTLTMAAAVVYAILVLGELGGFAP